MFSCALRFTATRMLFCALLCVAVPASPADAALFGPAAPPLRILYTADTLGTIHPCKTCGGASQGGLARRAALLQKFVSGQARPLVLAGPYEFYADRDELSPDMLRRITPALFSAFGRMPYTAIYLSPAADKALRDLGLTPPPQVVPVGDAPVTHVFRAGGITAACVFLPAGTAENNGPAPDQISAAQLAAKEAAATANLVIAVSPWGIQAENALAASFGGYFHIVLGGGEGIAVPGQATGDHGSPGPLWARSDRRGRAVTVLDIFAVPAPGSPWLEGINFASRLAFLDPELPQDEPVLTLLHGLNDAE